jgi:polyisoprenyl-teichoic acid--peptidoglycan teichoic acid transferase
VPNYTRYVADPPPRTQGPRWLRVLKWMVLVLVVCASVSAGAMASVVQHTAAQIAANNPKEVQAAKPQLVTAAAGRPVNILILGSDRRSGQPDVGARSDTLMVVRLDPRTGSISMLSVPRDLRVPIPGYGLNKINAAYSFGGARLSLQVTKQLLGIPINDFVDMNFDGFKQVINKLGGAYLMIDHRYYNNTAVTDYASIDIQPGYQRLSGADALSWVRFRHDQNGDFTRIVRQQTFLREMKRELMASAKLSSLPRFLSVMGIISHNVTTDISSLGKLYDLLTLALRLNTTEVYQTHIDGSTPMIGGVSYVTATQQQVATAVRQFLHPTRAPKPTVAAPVAAVSTATAAPSSTPQLTTAKAEVVVLNGSGRAGMAAAAASELTSRGYRVRVGGNAANFGFTTTTIAADAASQAVARRLAVALAPAHLQQSATRGGAITITLGSGFTGRLVPTSMPGSTQRASIAAGASPHDLSQWRDLQRQTSLPLFAPSSWSASLGYDQFRAYTVRTPTGSARAAVVVGTTPLGGYWDVQAIAWSDPPILASPDATRKIGGRTYLLFYDGAKLRMVAWHVGEVTYWVSNTLDEELTGQMMLSLATSSVPVG